MRKIVIFNVRMNIIRFVKKNVKITVPIKVIVIMENVSVLMYTRALTAAAVIARFLSTIFNVSTLAKKANFWMKR